MMYLNHWYFTRPHVHFSYRSAKYRRAFVLTRVQVFSEKLISTADLCIFVPLWFTSQQTITTETQRHGGCAEKSRLGPRLDNCAGALCAGTTDAMTRRGIETILSYSTLVVLLVYVPLETR
jgi:hypothetical protein